MTNINFEINVQGEGVPVIWGHGLMGSMAVEDAANWYKLDDLSKKAKLIRYDARGHGKSQSTYKSEDYHWENMAKDMLSIMDDLGIDQFIAGGQSLGCSTAIYAALQAPERVKGLILMNPPTAWETRAEQGALYKKMAFAALILGGGTLAKIIKKKPERLLPEWLISKDLDTISAYANAISSMSRRTLFNLLKGAMISNLPDRNIVGKITAPALILSWVGDKSHPVATGESLNELISGSKFLIANGIPEFKEWADHIKDFVESIEA